MKLFSAASRLAMIWLLLAAATSSGSASGRVQLIDNRYINMVIGIDEKVDPAGCQQVTAALMDLVNEASDYLYLATDRRASFGNVTIVLPRSWPQRCAGSRRIDEASTESLLTSDVRVSTDHPVHGSSPWTFQWGLCGQPGKFIQMSSDYLIGSKNASNLRARALVHEWAKYRWGVFDEAGYAGDPLYPSFYRSSPTEWIPTGCSDKKVSGTISPSGCKKELNECTFLPSTQQDHKSATTSIMDSPLLPQVHNFCDSSNHNSAAPTKHNIICRERSVWEIMLEHEDFRDGRNSPSTLDLPRKIRFNFVRARPDRFFFLIENSLVMRTRWDAVRDSVINYASWQAPTGAELAIGLFGDEFHKKQDLMPLEEGRRSMPGLQPYVDDISESQKRWTVAIDGAVAAMGPKAPGSTIIMVTGNRDSSSGSQPSPIDIKYMINKLKKHQLRLVVVFFPFVTPGLAEVAVETGGETITVLHDDENTLPALHSLMAAYDQTLNKYASNRRKLYLSLEQKEFIGLNKKMRGTFLMDDELNAKATMMILLENPSDIRYVKLRRPGEDYERATTFSANTYEVVAEFSKKAGRWEYEIELYEPTNNSVYVQVTAAPTSFRDAIQVEVWTNVDDHRTLNASQQPLAIYASVLRGNSPIIDANVLAFIDKPDGSQEQIQLLDNGLGVPDLTSGDGIYSRFFTHLSFDADTSSTEMKLSVQVGGEKSRVIIGRSSAAVTPRCCGSRLPADVRSEPVKDLRRLASAGSVTVLEAARSGEDIYPPTRVTDLRAEVNHTRQAITFRWTAPEDDLSNARVARYEVRFSEDREMLRISFSECTSVPHWTQPEMNGAPSVAVIDFNVFDQLLYFAIRAEDDAGNLADVSNIVPLVVHSPSTGSSESSTSVPSRPSRDSAGASGLLSLILILGAVTAVVILVVIVACHFHQNKKNTIRSKTVEAATPVKLDNSYISGGPSKPYPEQLKSGVDSLPNATPVMWSASDILRSPGDQRHHVNPAYSTYGGAASPSAYPPIRWSAARSESSDPMSARRVGNSYQTPYMDDMTYDSVGSQPTESTGSHTSDPMCGRLDGEAPVYGSSREPKVPPPTLPKPVLAVPVASVMGSWDSVTEKRRRNVTQV